MRGTLRTKRLPVPSCWMSSGSSRANLSVGKLIYLPSALSPPRSLHTSPGQPTLLSAAHAIKEQTQGCCCARAWTDVLVLKEAPMQAGSCSLLRSEGAADCSVR